MYVKNKEDLKEYLKDLNLRYVYTSLKDRNLDKEPIDEIAFFDDFIDSIYQIRKLNDDVLAIEEFIESKVKTHQDGRFYLSKLANYFQELYIYSGHTDEETREIEEFLVTIQNRLFPKSAETNEEENPKQLSVNQCVLLLDRLGAFTIEIENWEKTKKAKLISSLIGRDEKNIKTSIEKLDKDPNELGPQHSKDLKKIEDLFNLLE